MMANLSTSRSHKCVLVCLKESKREVEFLSCEESSEEERKTFIDAVHLVFSDLLSSPSPPLVIQVKNENWEGEFVDLGNKARIEHHSVLRVIPLCESGSAKGKGVAIKGSRLCKKMSEPSEAEREQLAKLFPGSSASGTTRKRAFDPQSESVVAVNQRKKKAAVKTVRPVTREVVMLGGYSQKVPRNKIRQKLKESYRIKGLQFTRVMSAQEVRDVVRSGFDKLPGFDDYTYLSTKKDDLEISHKQDLDGTDVIARRGALYVCEKWKTDVIEIDDSSSVVGTSIPPSATAGRSLSPVDTSEVNPAGGQSETTPSPDVPPAPPVAVSGASPLLGIGSEVSLSPYDGSRSRCIPAVASTVSSMVVSAPLSDHIHEWRALREEQDMEYQESLKADQEKDAVMVIEQERKERLTFLREALNEQLVRAYCLDSVQQRGSKVVIRLPSEETLSPCFIFGTPIKVLYQYVFVKSKIDAPFGLFKLYPRKLLNVNTEDLIESVQDSVLAVEINENNPDYFDPANLLKEDLTFGESDVEQVLDRANNDRTAFIKSMDSHPGITHQVARSDIVRSVLSLYSGRELEALLSEYPLRISFEGERAVDLGGVCRDMFSSFFEAMYRVMFDGNILLTPVVHPQIDLAMLSTVGTIISHGYLTCGILPLRIAFPALVCCILGMSTIIPGSIITETFIDSISPHEADSFKTAFAQIKQNPSLKAFGEELSSKLVAVMSRYGCRQYPSPAKLKQMLLQIASYELSMKPAIAITAINKGIPSVHVPFWQQLGVVGILAIYRAQSISPTKVLGMLDEEQGNTANEERVLGYLRQFIASLSHEDLRLFLRFCTGSTVYSGGKLSVFFNALEGISRRPIAHTCEPSVELSVNYATFPEFVSEFKAYLADNNSWIMDAI